MSASPVVIYRNGYTKEFARDPNGSETSSSTKHSNSITLQKGRIGGNTKFKNWRIRINNGQETTSSLDAVGYKLDWNATRGASALVGADPSNLRKLNTIESLQYVNLPVQSWGPLVGVGQADNVALTRFISKARAAQSSFMGGVFVGEVREAVRMLRPSTSAFLKGLYGYLADTKKVAARLQRSRRDRYRAARGLPPLPGRSAKEVARARAKALSGMWLEHSFGWTPFISDIESARDELVRIGNEGVETKRVQGSGRSTSKSVTIDATAITIGSMTQYFNRKTENYQDIRYIGAVRLTSALSSPISGVAEKLGFTVSQFLPTVYELIPYSFLLDYFTNVGDIVSAVSFPRSSLYYVVRGTKWSNSVSHTPSRVVMTPAGAYTAYASRSISGGTATLEQFGVSRRKYEGSLVPSLAFEIPGMARQYANMSALAVAHVAAKRFFT